MRVKRVSPHLHKGPAGEYFKLSLYGEGLFLHLLISAREMWKQTWHLGLCSHSQYEAPWQHLPVIYAINFASLCLLGRPARETELARSESLTLKLSDKLGTKLPWD